MPVCNFFLQGRCRYGDKCWNEHPRGGGGGGGRGGNYNRSSAPQQNNRGGGGGFSNRVWVNPSQRSGGSYIQPSTFGGGSESYGHGGEGTSDWGRGGGGGRRENVKSSDFSFGQNRFSALSSASSFDKGGRASGAVMDENEKMLDTIHKDIDIWEVSGQWKISCYGITKSNISGFTDLSPEELRLEYYSARATGDPQTYSNGVNQLFNQWKSRIQELKMMNANTCSSLFSEPSTLTSQPSSGGFGLGMTPGFGSSTSSSSFGAGGFGAPAPAQASTFSFAPPSTGLGSTGAPAAPAGFGSAMTAPAAPPSGFGSSSTAPTASSFSFAPPSSDKAPPTSGFGSAAGFGSASGFSLSSIAAGGGFGSGFGSGTAPAGGGTGFGSTTAGSIASGGVAADSVFTPQSELSPEELNQFQARRFTLGQIPLKPPPADLLMVEII